MEPHRTLGAGIEEFRPKINAGAQEYFDLALAFTRRYYGQEMDFIASTKFDEVTPDYFFREYVWVVHATGFSAKAVGTLMPRLLDAYGPWEQLAWEKSDDVVDRVKKVVNNPQKLRAVHAMAGRMAAGIRDQDWVLYKNEHLSTTEKLAELPYIGRITRFHLGRNIGLLECVKPDLHLERLAKHWGFKGSLEMCQAVRPAGMPLGIVDLCFWYAASTFGTLETRKEGDR